MSWPGRLAMQMNKLEALDGIRPSTNCRTVSLADSDGVLVALGHSSSASMITNIGTFS